MAGRSLPHARRSRNGAAAGSLAIEIVDRQRRLRVSASWLAAVARAALTAERVRDAEICILVVNDRRIARLHDEWFDDPSPTDVITFNLSDGGDPVLRGDIAVSAETATRMARHPGLSRPGWTPRHELAYYVVHGILHLTGYDDRAPADRRAMRARERAVMRAAGLPAPPRSVGRLRS